MMHEGRVLRPDQASSAHQRCHEAVLQRQSSYPLQRQYHCRMRTLLSILKLLLTRFKFLTGIQIR